MAALAELFTADRWSESSDTLLNAPLSLTFGKVGKRESGHAAGTKGCAR